MLQVREAQKIVTFKNNLKKEISEFHANIYEHKNQIKFTHFVPRLRLFRWPGTNLDAVEAELKDLVADTDFAGERFKEAIATESTLQDPPSFDAVLAEDELGTEDEGSNLRDFLQK